MVMSGENTPLKLLVVAGQLAGMCLAVSSRVLLVESSDLHLFMGKEVASTSELIARFPVDSEKEVDTPT